MMPSGISECFVFLDRHPDKNKDPSAEDMFIKITKSYEVGFLTSA